MFKMGACFFIKMLMLSMQMRRCKLVTILDEATKEAAETENMQQIRTFNQVLKFDINRHVKYFP